MLCRGVGGSSVEEKIISGVGVAVKERRAEELLCSCVSGWSKSRRCCVEVLEDGVLVAVGLMKSQSEKRRRSN
jgi:hypothetical protein